MTVVLKVTLHVQSPNVTSASGVLERALAESETGRRLISVESVDKAEANKR